MKPLTFYIIFHDNLYESNTQTFTKEEHELFFCWLAVNEKIKKDIPEWIPKSSLLKEYEMKIYSPLHQMLHFYQNSAFFHLYWNKHLINSRYIGFGQYDMNINADEFRKVYYKIKDDVVDNIVGIFLYKFETLYSNVITKEGWQICFLNPYNDFFGTSHTFEMLEKTPLFLLHTFIIPTWYFLHIMPFIEYSLPIIIKTLNWETKYIAGTLERIFALAISSAIIEGKFTNLLKLDGITHIETQHSKDSFRGI